MGKLIFYALVFVTIAIVVWMDDRYDLLGRFDAFTPQFDSESVQSSPVAERVSSVGTPDSAVTPIVILTATSVPVVSGNKSDTTAPRSSWQVPFIYMPSHSSGTNEVAHELARLDMLALINNARSQAGVAQVKLGDNPSPQAHAEFMRDGCVVSHTGSGGSNKRQRWERNGGATNVVLAENVNGYRTCTFSVPSSRSIGYYVKKLMDSLMDSAEHRAIIEDGKYDEVHIGFAINGNGAWVTQLFVDLR